MGDENDKILELESEVKYLTDKLKNIYHMLTSDEDKHVIIGYVRGVMGSLNTPLDTSIQTESKNSSIKLNIGDINKLVESILAEWRPNVSFNAWADLESNGTYQQGVNNRRKFTRAQNAKNEKISELKTIKDFAQLINELGPDGLEEYTDRIFKSAVRNLPIKMLHTLSLMDFIKGTKLVELINVYLSEHEDELGYYNK